MSKSTPPDATGQRMSVQDLMYEIFEYADLHHDFREKDGPLRDAAREDLKAKETRIRELLALPSETRAPTTEALLLAEIDEKLDELGVPSLVENGDGLRLSRVGRIGLLATRSATRTPTETTGLEARYEAALRHIAENAFAGKDWTFARNILNGDTVEEARERVRNLYGTR